MSKKMVIQEFDASVVIDIYLDGFATGIATAYLNSGATQEAADAASDEMTRLMQRDPVVMEVIRKEVLDRMRGVDDGPHTVTARIEDPA